MKKLERRNGFLLWLFAVMVGMALHAPIASAVVTVYKNAVIFGSGASTCTGALGKSCSGLNVMYTNSGDGQVHAHLASGTEFAIPQTAIAPGGGYATVKNAGTPLAQRASVNLIGANASCVDNAGAISTDCTFTTYGVTNAGDYNIVCDGVTDNTTAMQNAANAALDGMVQLPNGTCNVSGTITMHRGTRFRGVNGPTDTVGIGTVVMSTGNNTNLFVWDGNGSTSAAGYGGGLENLLVLKQSGKSGGDAIYITSTDDNHRPGEMLFKNVVIGGQNNAGLWSRDFHLDGSANNTTGSRGIRSVRFEKFRGSACDGTTYPDQCVYLTQATHFSAEHLEIDPVGAVGAVGMTIGGNFDQIYIPATEINGDVVISNPTDTAYNPNVFITGRVGGTFTNNSTKLVGRAVVTTTSFTNASPSFDIINVGSASTTFGTWYNVGATTVQDTSTPIGGDVFVVRDSPGNKFFDVTDNGPISIKPNGADGASAVGLDINTIASWVTAGAKLIRARIQGGSDVFNVGYNGLVTTTQGYVGPTVGPSSSQQHTLPAVASDTVCLLAASQTETNKTLTSPIINGVTSTSGNVDWSGSAGTFKTPTGAATFGGSSNAFTNEISLPAGTGTATGKAPVTIYSDTTVTSSVTTGETDGSTFTMPANTMSSNGMELRVSAAWTHAANANSTTAKLYVCGTAIVSQTNSTSSDTLGTELRLVRTSSSVMTYLGVTQNPNAGYVGQRGSVTGVNFASSCIIKISVTGATTNADLSTSYLRVEWWPN